MIRLVCLALTTAMALTGGASAQTAIARDPQSARPISLAGLSPPRLNLKPVSPVPLSYDQAPAPLPRGVARTSVERREGAVSSAAGLLCGIQPSADRSGIGSARGYNTEGRFIGGKLAFSF